MSTFQQLVLRLQDYWGRNGCAILQPYDMEVGAGTSHTADWSLAPGTWAALAEGVNHVSVRAWTTGDELSTTLVEPIYTTMTARARICGSLTSRPCARPNSPLR